MNQEEKYVKAVQDFIQFKKSFFELTLQQRQQLFNDIVVTEMMNEITRYTNYNQEMNGYYNRF